MRLRNFVSISERLKLLTIFTSGFAFLYHFAFMFVFLGIKVYAMFYFNIVSSLLFFVIAILVHKTKKYTPMFFVSLVEVLLHQVCAEYFLGSQSSFHFLILVISFLPYIGYVDDFKLTIPFSIVPISLFTILEIFKIEPSNIYAVSKKTVFVIQIVNISLSVCAIFIMMFLYAFIVFLIEKQLDEKVHEQADKLQKQNENIINIQKNTIEKLSNLVENRDSDTGEHIKRTSAYVYLIASAAKKAGYYSDILTDSYIEMLYRAAPMHDIGKITVSDVVLKKPGKLSNTEFKEIQKHSLEGGRIISEILGKSEDSSYINVASEIATSHHEKWDGTGYPYKISGEQIPLSARIMAIADVFDALVSKRCYKEEIDTEQAFKIIEDSMGTHFDPILTKLFLDNKDAIVKILEQYKD